jgi:hypothetical protein
VSKRQSTKLARGYADNMALLTRLLLLAIRSRDLETASDICGELAASAQSCRGYLAMEIVAAGNSEPSVAKPPRKPGRKPGRPKKAKTP